MGYADCFPLTAHPQRPVVYSLPGVPHVHSFSQLCLSRKNEQHESISASLLAFHLKQHNTHIHPDMLYSYNCLLQTKNLFQCIQYSRRDNNQTISNKIENIPSSVEMHGCTNYNHIYTLFL